MAVSDEQSPIAFDVWWEEHGGDAIPDSTSCSNEEFVEAIRATARNAWRQGAYHAMTGNLTPPTH